MKPWLEMTKRMLSPQVSYNHFLSRVSYNCFISKFNYVKENVTQEEEAVAEDQDKENSGEEEAVGGVDTADEAEDAEDDSEETAEDNTEEGAEVGTLQLAWEVLELARTIYEK